MKKVVPAATNASEVAVPAKSEFSLIDENLIKSRINTIRGKQVMLDCDLAALYGVETRRINEQVKRNIERFPEEFCFQITPSEIPERLKSQIATLNNSGNQRGLHIKKMPYVFSEQGVAMLSAVLHSPTAIKASIEIMDAFVEMRHFLAVNSNLLGSNELVNLSLTTAQNTRDIASVSTDVKALSGEVHEMQGEFSKMNADLQKVMDNFIDPSTYKHFLILNGRKLEADIAYTQIYDMAKKSIIIIDDYVGVKTLDLLREIAKDLSITIYSDGRGFETLTEQMKTDFLAVRPDVALDMKRTNGKFHDRYIFLDYGTKSEKLFHCGASSKDAGNKITTIMQVECTEIYHAMIDMLERS